MEGGRKMGGGEKVETDRQGKGKTKEGIGRWREERSLRRMNKKEGKKGRNRKMEGGEKVEKDEQERRKRKEGKRKMEGGEKIEKNIQESRKKERIGRSRKEKG